MKNLRQLLRRPVRACDAEMWDEQCADGSYVVYVTCVHLKQPRSIRLLPDLSRSDEERLRAWNKLEGDLGTHVKYSDPW